MDISKLEERDQQEVVGYFEVLDLIDEGYRHLPVSENGLKNLHNQLLKYSQKDQWHKGNYKQHTNAIEAHLPDGTSQIIFHTTPPGFPTEDAKRHVVYLIGLFTGSKQSNIVNKNNLEEYFDSQLAYIPTIHCIWILLYPL